MGLELHPGISFCAVSDILLFLDLPRNRYFRLGPAGDRALTKLLKEDCLDEADLVAVEGMIAKGILHRTKDDSRPTPCLHRPRPRESILVHPVASSAVQFLQAARDMVQVAAALRVRPRALLTKLEARQKSPGTSLTEEGVAIASAYRALRMLVGGYDRCLLYSLAMSRSLSRQRIDHDIVFGVRARPFQAHCWVQSGDILLNDRVENVAQFSPIRVL